MAKRLSHTKIDRIIKLRKERCTINSIADTVSCSPATVARVCQRAVQAAPHRTTKGTTTTNAYADAAITLWTADKDPLRDVLKSNLNPVTKVRLASLLLDERRG